MSSQTFIDDLFTLTLDELQAKYMKPKNKDSLQELRRYYRKKLNMERAPDPVEPEKRLTGTWESLIKNADGEAEIHTLHKYAVDFNPDQMAFEPATPAKITPTRRKRIERVSKFVLAYGDGQVDFRRIIDPVTQEQEMLPLHNVPMLRIIQQFNAKYMPETTVNGGDFADMSALSRFPADSDHFHKTLAPSMQYIHDFYAQFVADNPKGHHVEVDSNHAVRPKRRILQQMPEFYDFVLPGEDYPLLSYYRLANLGKLGIDFKSGYGAAEFIYGEEYGEPPIVFKHGNHSSSTPGATVAKESRENPEVNVFRFHGHHDEEVRRTTRDGHQLFYKMIGSSCLNRGPVPGYDSAVDDHNRPVKKYTNHQNTFAMIEDFQNGQYNITTINVIDGQADYLGEHFDGRE